MQVDANTHASAPARQSFGVADPLLMVSMLGVRFGGITALEDVAFDVAPGAVQGVIGPNGAGKTTLFNCISRLYQPYRGSIRFEGAEILGLPRHAIARLGIARTFQNVALFNTMSARDNVLVGGHVLGKGGFVANAARLPRATAAARAVGADVDRILELLGLMPVASKPAGALPFGTRKRIELARALAGRPKLLLLDEPAAGLNHEEVDQLGELVVRLRQEFGLTVLLVEHHMRMVMGICDRIVALNFGRKIAEGTPREVREHPDVVRAYLGADG